MGQPDAVNCATIFLGHFEPRIVAAMEQDAGIEARAHPGCQRGWSEAKPAQYNCFVMIRDPVERAMAHYSWYYWDLKQDQSIPPFERAPWHMKEIFSDNVMVHFLGDGRLDAAKKVIDRCLVGLHEELQLSMVLASLHLRWMEVPAFERLNLTQNMSPSSKLRPSVLSKL